MLFRILQISMAACFRRAGVKMFHVEHFEKYPRRPDAPHSARLSFSTGQNAFALEVMEVLFIHNFYFKSLK